MSLTKDQLQSIISNIETLAHILPGRQMLTSVCKQLGWSVRHADELILEFKTPLPSPFLVDCYAENSVSGGFITFSFLAWDEYNQHTIKSQQLKADFNAEYFETVSIAENILGKSDLVIVELQPSHQCTIWRRPEASLFLLQGADDIEGIDIRLWIEYLSEKDDIPDSQIFDWLCQRHLTKIEQSTD